MVLRLEMFLAATVVYLDPILRFEISIEDSLRRITTAKLYCSTEKPGLNYVVVTLLKNNDSLMSKTTVYSQDRAISLLVDLIDIFSGSTETK
jgi:hypothetical protein